MGERYTARQFIDVIPGTGGIISDIARRVGCQWHTAKRYIDVHPTVRRAYEAERENVLDLAETELHKTIKQGEPWAVKFYLTTIGKHRGYTERQELTGAEGAPLTIVFKRKASE